MKLPLAAVTMCYDEPQLLPLWLAYYSRQVGAANCYVLDDGSDDGSTDDLGAVSVVRFPRLEHDNARVSLQVGKFCASLLTIYERVIYADTDEFIVADPGIYGGLVDFCERAQPGVVTMFGVDVLHDLDNEPALDMSAPILGQRRWCRPNGFLCKPSLVNREVSWWTGFHGYDGGAVFDDIYLFHLANADRELIIERQKKRNRSVAVDGSGGHHAYSPEEMIADVRRILDTSPRVPHADLAMGDPDREGFLDLLFDPSRPRHEQSLSNHGCPAPLFVIPERLRECI
jgi:hypothetical protein